MARSDAAGPAPPIAISLLAPLDGSAEGAEKAELLPKDRDSLRRGRCAGSAGGRSRFCARFGADQFWPSAAMAPAMQHLACASVAIVVSAFNAGATVSGWPALATNGAASAFAVSIKGAAIWDAAQAGRLDIGRSLGLSRLHEALRLDGHGNKWRRRPPSRFQSQARPILARGKGGSILAAAFASAVGAVRSGLSGPGNKWHRVRLGRLNHGRGRFGMRNSRRLDLGRSLRLSWRRSALGLGGLGDKRRGVRLGGLNLRRCRFRLRNNGRFDLGRSFRVSWRRKCVPAGRAWGQTARRPPWRSQLQALPILAAEAGRLDHGRSLRVSCRRSALRLGRLGDKRRGVRLGGLNYGRCRFGSGAGRLDFGRSLRVSCRRGALQLGRPGDKRRGVRLGGLNLGRCRLRQQRPGGSILAELSRQLAAQCVPVGRAWGQTAQGPAWRSQSRALPISATEPGGSILAGDLALTAGAEGSG